MRTLSKQSFANGCFYALKNFCFKEIPNGTQDIFRVRKANFSLSVNDFIDSNTRIRNN